MWKKYKGVSSTVTTWQVEPHQTAVRGTGVGLGLICAAPSAAPVPGLGLTPLKVVV